MYNRLLIFRLNIHFIQTVMISVIEELRVNFRLRVRRIRKLATRPSHRVAMSRHVGEKRRHSHCQYCAGKSVRALVPAYGSCLVRPGG